MPIPPHVSHEIVHKALASDIRRRIILVLAKKPKYLSEIAEEIGKKPQTIDFHLNLLAEIGLVVSNWIEGKKYYSLKDKKIIEFITEKRAVPPGFHPKPPHEIVIDAWKDLSKRLSKIEKQLDEIKEKIK
ncbi:MAG: winged helix-turn-helix transcriptional regulator [Nanoarchaeota archaeon]|nr:winged helix-turn-helix transcriptional regulator [Nanoarchaeota archaeon]